MDDALLRAKQQAAHPAVHLVKTKSSGLFSKIGGEPNLPADLAWPEWQGHPLGFVAQIDFAELAAHCALPDFPASGQLFFFYDLLDERWGFDPADKGCSRVLYSPATTVAQPRPTPAELEEYGADDQFLAFRKIDSHPGIQRLVEATEDNEDYYETNAEAEAELYEAQFRGEPKHQMGGYPVVEQNDTMELECQLVSHGINCGDAEGRESEKAQQLAPGAQDWTLLLQVDTDWDGMMWGDCGKIFFWIRSEDLQQRDFSKVWLILQCG
jgi:uncharacterized protein YwqG